MANKKVSQLVSKPSVLVTDLFPIADPTTGQLFKTTISDLGTAIGSGVSSVNGLVGAVVLDTDDIQELASPTNRWFTDTRARAALSASSPLAYNSGTGVFSLPQADGSTNGFLSSADWTTFNAKQAALSGTGFVKISGTTISYDNSTYLTTSAAASTYLALSGGTLTGALNGTSATFSGDVTLSATNPRLYFTDTDNNPDYFISNTDGTFTVYDVTNSTSRFTIGTTGNGTFGGNLTVGQIIRSGGTSSQFLKADGSVDSSTYAKRSGLTDGYLPAWSSSLLGGSLTDSFISYASNITYVAGMGLSTLNGLDIEGNYGAGTGGLKIRSYDETTGNAYIDFANTGGRMYLGLNRSTSGGLMTNATAYATVLTTGLGTSNLEFGTNATKRMTIDGTTGAVTLTSALSGTSASFSGNVSIGGAASSWAFFKAFQIGNASFVGYGNQAEIWNNSYFDGASKYYGNGFATRFGSDLGEFFWYTAGNNTSGAGAAISFTKAMTLGANSGLSIGTTSAAPTNGLLVAGAATFSSSVGTTALNMNNMASLGSIGGGAIYLPYTAGLFFRTLNGATARGKIQADDSNNLLLNSDNGGNVGIGTSSPASGRKLTVAGGAQFTFGDNSGASFNIVPGTNGQDGADFNLSYYTGTGYGPLTFTLGGSERMRITSAGNVGIGTTSPSARLDVLSSLNVQASNNSDLPYINFSNNGTVYNWGRVGGLLQGDGDGALYFQTKLGGGLTEKMRITSGGNVLIGTTTDLAYKLNVNGSIFAGNIIETAGSNSGLIYGNRSDSTKYTFYATGGYTYFYNSGNISQINMSNGVYTALSDINKKKDFEDSTIGLNEVLQLKPTLYRMKSNSSNSQKELGFLAQEVKDYIPQAYVESDGFIGLNDRPILAAAIKAIQELKAELDTLKNK